jgi:hypothetical protein
MPVIDTNCSVASLSCLKPLASQADALSCYACALARAKWTIRHPRYGVSPVPLCALCFLQTSGWVQPNEARLQDVLGAQALRKRRAIPTVDGIPSDVKDADNVLGSLVLHDRFQALNQRGVS